MPKKMDLVDLTGDTGSESSVAGDEVVVRTYQQFNPAESAFPGPLDTLALTETAFRQDAENTGRHASPLNPNGNGIRNTAPAAPASNPAEVQDISGTPKSNRLAARDDAKLSSSQKTENTTSTTQSGLSSTPLPRSTMELAVDMSPPAPLILRTPEGSEWTTFKIHGELQKCKQDMRRDHSWMVRFRLEEAALKAYDARGLSTFDAFADMKSTDVRVVDDEKRPKDVLIVKFKQHPRDGNRSKGSRKRCLFQPVCIKTDREAVPKYKFHHVEIAKNILTPNTLLNFIPHLRDMTSSGEEAEYCNWIDQLDSLDRQSGFNNLDRHARLILRRREERAAVPSLYLDRWIKRLGIKDLNKQVLVRYMTSQSRKDDAMTPQQKSMLDSQSEGVGSSQTMQLAKMFTEAFNLIFDETPLPGGVPLNGLTGVALRDVLLLDKTMEAIADNKRVKDTSSQQHQPEDKGKDLLGRVETALASYAILGCAICFAHDCEHGEFWADNQRRAFSNDSITVPMLLRRKWTNQMKDASQSGKAGIDTSVLSQPCKNQCYRQYDIGNIGHPMQPWSRGEIDVLESVFASLGHCDVEAQCSVAAILGKKCWEVYRKMKQLDLKLPHTEAPGPIKVKPLSWYDRKKKQLFGDWTDLTVSHDYTQREIIEPCHHEGPCNNKCPCWQARQLCERFCHCTEEMCAMKFTGCACHSSGKTCLQRQKEGKPCICVQLNRECDPMLCKGCGAATRADPDNAYDEALHATGCQNVSLQRGSVKKLLVGKSQLEACGYGLFTTEDFSTEEFVIEYTGEIITHDEGVKREARRGNVFDEKSNVSYLFTLLEQDGIWVDAAIYGNLSRYINHASEGDRKGCNITPKILYVNGEYRIRFTALRDIKAGEELFFNYGENFPNLTKKLLDGKEVENKTQQATGKRKAGCPRENGKGNSKVSGKGGEDGLDWMTEPLPDLEMEDADDYEERTPRQRRQRKKRGGRRPGAGRKPKKPPSPPSPPSPPEKSDPDPEENDVDGEFQPDGSGSQGETSDKFNQVKTPSPRRKSKRNSGSAQSLRPSTQEQEQRGLEGVPLKIVSKRGGARPGAGRKPKRPKPTPVVVPNSDEDEDAALGHSPPIAAVGRQKGKGRATDDDPSREADVEMANVEMANVEMANVEMANVEVADVEMADAPSNMPDRSEPMPDKGGQDKEDRNHEDGNNGDEDDVGNGVIDRSSRQRQRQPPARYRNGDFEFS